MISPPQYQPLHTSQLKSLYQKGHQSQLCLHPSHKLYYASLLKNKFYSAVRKQLQQKKSHNAMQLCWLIIALSMTQGNYLVPKARLADKYGKKWIQIIDRWLLQEESTASRILRPMDSCMQQIRLHFQHLTQKSTRYQYFTLRQVPVYLISTQWLQRFYDTTSHQPIGPIDNRILLKPMKFIDTDCRLVHLNYQVKSQMKQNKDYKLLSPDCWKFLYQRFSGIEVKRFTTDQKQPTVEVCYRKLVLSVTEDRYFHVTGMELLCSRFTKFTQLLQRIKRLLIAYSIVPFASLKHSLQFIKINDLSETEIIDLIQDQQLEQLEQDDQRFQKIQQQINVEEAKIYSYQQHVVLNIVGKDKDNDFFAQVGSVQTVIMRDSCLKCGTYEDVFLCICKSVHFCSHNCQRNHKEHAKDCQKIRRDQIQVAKLIKDYDITQRQFQLTHEMILTNGKVGLQNLRNTCYLNSAIQCILRVDKLVKYFSRNDHLSDLNVDNVLGSEGHLACAFGELVKKYYSTPKRSISPIDVIRIIAKNPQFRGAQHQDSQEFLNYFLDKLHEDLNKIKRKPYIEEIESDGRPDEDVSKESWENYLKRNKSLVQELFAGQYRSEIRCPDCERISITFDPFMSVTLQFPKVQDTLLIKGYLLARNGEYLKMQAYVPPSTLTREFLAKTFRQKVVAVTIKNKVVKKEWREQLMLSKNFSDEGIILFYIKEDNWERMVDMHFLDEKKELSAFNRRMYVKNPQSIEDLKREIHSRIRVPIEKALGQNFQTQEEYLQYCETHQPIIFNHPQEDSLMFPLPEGPLTLRLQFNPEIKYKQKPKLNLSLKSYDPMTQFKSKDFSMHGLSIHDMLENFCLPQKLTEDNMWYCSKCKDHKMADKVMRLYKLPQTLIIHLKRFNHKSTRYRNLIGVQKIELKVKLQEFEVINGVKYELVGVVNHFGSMSFGHYTAYVKKDQWVKCDDESVKRCNVNGDSAYLVVYRRCEGQAQE